MSGLEIAGVVLGALPLVISALEHYAEGANTAKRYWKYKSELRSLILQLNTERSIFINTLEQLLTGILRVENMTDVVADAGGDAWRKWDVDIKLKDRLRGAYPAYVDNIRGMKSALELMMKKLALDPDGQPQFSDTSLFKQEYKRLKFSISKSEYSEQITHLKNHNLALAQLTRQSVELEPTRAVARARACPGFKGLQALARTLYDTLRIGLQCAGGCQGHAVKLRLEHRDLCTTDSDKLQKETPFRVVFKQGSDSQWQEADIRHIIEQAKRVAISNCSPNATTLSAARKRVRFGEPAQQSQHDQNNRNATLTVVQHRTAFVLSTMPRQTQSLCSAIAKLQKQQQQQEQSENCLGYVLDAQQRKHGIYLGFLSHCHEQQPWSSLSLRQILNGQANAGLPLTRYDRLRTAVHLSSSILQLYKTPWLDEAWGKDDVYFISKPGSQPRSTFEHPYVNRELSASRNGHASQNQQARYRVIRNQTLFTLGVLFIEIWYGKSLDQLQTPSDLDCVGTPGVACCTAE